MAAPENRVKPDNPHRSRAKRMTGCPSGRFPHQFRPERATASLSVRQRRIAKVNGRNKRRYEKEWTSTEKGMKRRVSVAKNERNDDQQRKGDERGGVGNKLPRSILQFVCRTRPFVDTILLSSTEMRVHRSRPHRWITTIDKAPVNEFPLVKFSSLANQPGGRWSDPSFARQITTRSALILPLPFSSIPTTLGTRESKPTAIPIPGCCMKQLLGFVSLYRVPLKGIF